MKRIHVAKKKVRRIRCVKCWTGILDRELNKEQNEQRIELRNWAEYYLQKIVKKMR